MGWGELGEYKAIQLFLPAKYFSLDSVLGIHKPYSLIFLPPCDQDYPNYQCFTPPKFTGVMVFL